MATAICKADTLIALSLAAALGSADLAYAQSDPGLPTCTGWSSCNRGRPICTIVNQKASFLPIVVSDFAGGVSSDGRGPYMQKADGVQWSVIHANAGLSLRHDPDSVKAPRTFRVNLNNPVPGSGGVPLGTITSGNDDNLYTAWIPDGATLLNLHDMSVGQTVTAAQMNVSVHIDGRFHVLQMGPVPLGICHNDSTRVHGAGTSSGTILRASETKWVVDLPAGSVGRLFDLSNTTRFAVDKGLYYLRLHYAIGR